MPRAVLGQNGLGPPYFAISCPWGSGQRKRDVKELRNFGEKVLGRLDFPLKSAPSTGKLHFYVFRPGPGISLSAKGRPRAVAVYTRHLSKEDIPLGLG